MGPLQLMINQVLFIIRKHPHAYAYTEYTVALKLYIFLFIT